MSAASALRSWTSSGAVSPPAAMRCSSRCTCSGWGARWGARLGARCGGHRVSGGVRCSIDSSGNAAARPRPMCSTCAVSVQCARSMPYRDATCIYTVVHTRTAATRSRSTNLASWSELPSTAGAATAVGGGGGGGGGG
eukprot:scaffold93731_cov78-Phaeocystis_antarctica.AAC.1